jgi:adenine-specific DNA-methyltransferase
MANLSQEKRKRMLAFLNTLKENNKDDDKTLIAINEIENALNEKKYGLVWEKHEEAVDVKMRTHIPVFTEDKDREITAAPGEPYNFLLEGDNLHSLRLLEKTHKGRIDVIYIDPPYNRGENDFVYDDNYVDKDDTFKHSKWLSFMFERLTLARVLLSKYGIIIINIDEHEQNNLSILMNQIFGEQNNLGEIIWNKGNPKGDAKAISTMHETIICYAKNKEEFQSLSGICIRKKTNAESIIKKANSLYKKIGKSLIPDDVKKAIKPFGYSKEIQKDFYVKYDLELVNKEFQNWLSNQNFSGGEKAYKYIDDKGRVYRGVSMAWPNKKTAPDDYFVPLVHPATGKKCPVPSRGWRYPSTTMKKLKDQGLIIFGEDETKQPEHKYYLDENLFENVPSIYFNASSADNMLKDLDISFENAKPISEAKYILSTLLPNPKIVLDFFAGSGTTAQAVLELNKENNLDCRVCQEFCVNRFNKQHRIAA